MDSNTTTNWQELLEPKTIITFGDLKIESRAMFLLAGQSMAGKTITCLHLANEAVKINKKVLYVDTEEKSIISRPQPNLFKEFYNLEQDKYDKCFKYLNEFNKSEFLNLLDKEKPDLVIIDSLYIPFLKECDEPRTRAKNIKEFLVGLKEYVWKHELACIITTPVGRVVDPLTGKEKLVPLGGEGMKYLSDIKILIQFIEKEDDDAELSGKRVFIIDRQIRIAFKIEYGGHLVPIC